MLPAIVWGLIQGLTEFLPVSSSGHLVIVPAFLDRLGWDVGQPNLAVSAVLHLGTLLAVLGYFRSDLLKVLRFRTDDEGRRIATLVAVGTIPALIGYPFSGQIDAFQDSSSNVGWALIGTGVILVVGQYLAHGARQLDDGRVPDAVVVGLAQMLALIPGISRSGATIAAGNARGFAPSEAARFSFLLGIPAIAGGGLSQLLSIADSQSMGLELLVGTVVAAISGYAAIALLLTALRRVGLAPFAAYCFTVGAVAIFWLG